MATALETTESRPLSGVMRLSPDSLPNAFSIPSLSCLINGSIELQNHLQIENIGPESGAHWFRNLDALLRAAPGRQQILEAVKSMRGLRQHSLWDTFLETLVADARQASRLRREQGRLRSMWGVTPINSLKTGSAADRGLGVEAESVVYTTYYVTRDFDINLSEHLSIVQHEDDNLVEDFSWLVFCWAMISFDVFFLFNDRGLLPPDEFTGRFRMGISKTELRLLRQAEKILFTLPYGADYRTRQRTLALGKFNFCMDCPSIGQFCFCSDDQWDVVFNVHAAYATAVLGSGLALHQVPRARRLDYVVIDTVSVEPCYPLFRSGRKVKLLHVPNHPHFKGTRYLEEAVKRLIDEGMPIEFTLTSGISNQEVLALMREADVVVDQLIGGYFGQTALEAMALGKPVVVYLADPSLVAGPSECPLINANPDTIYDVLLSLTKDPAQLPMVGRRSRAYVEKYYSVGALTAHLHDLYWEAAGIRVGSIPVASSDPLRG